MPSRLLCPYSGEQAQLGLDRSLVPIEKCLLLWIGNGLLTPMPPWLNPEDFGGRASTSSALQHSAETRIQQSAGSLFRIEQHRFLHRRPQICPEPSARNGSGRENGVCTNLRPSVPGSPSKPPCCRRRQFKLTSRSISRSSLALKPRLEDSATGTSQTLQDALSLST